MRFFTKMELLSLVVIVFSSTTVRAQLTIQSGVELKTTNNAIITLQNIDLVNNGTINQQTGDGRFVFAGTTNNFISGNSPTFDIFEIAKTGSAKILLSQNINIGSTVYFTSGLIDLNNHNILLQPSAVLYGENETSRVTGINGGYIQISNTLNAPSSINPGNLGAVISSTQNPGTTIIRRGHQSQVNGNNAGNSIYRYYDIIPANNAALNATLRINYFDAELNGLPENALTFWTSSNNTNWTNMGYSTRDATSNYVTLSGLAGFSRLTISSVNNALPIKFSSFLVQCLNGAAAIYWKTAQEENSSYFEIQKSADAIQWQKLTTIAAAGNSSVEKQYSYTDNNAFAGKTFYRIAEYDLNGAVMYSTIASSSCGLDNENISYYPNPVKSLLWITLSAQAATTVKIETTDSKGAVIRSQINNLVMGRNLFSVNMAGFSAGVYQLVLHWDNGNKIKTIKIVKQ